MIIVTFNSLHIFILLEHIFNCWSLQGCCNVKDCNYWSLFLTLELCCLNHIFSSTKSVHNLINTSIYLSSYLSFIPFSNHTSLHLTLLSRNSCSFFFRKLRNSKVLLRYFFHIHNCWRKSTKNWKRVFLLSV